MLTQTLTESNAQALSEEVIRTMPAYPGGYKGRGIVICGGGQRYFTCAWVCINMLRQLGCDVPIQLWYLGRYELDEPMRALVKPLGVECVDAMEVRRRHPARMLAGFEAKPYAIMHSPFREVLLLDADNVPLINPEALFRTPQFQETGAIFWPDFGRLQPWRPIWHICGIPYRDEPEFESGQIVIDKEKCWRAMVLCRWYNDYSDFFYKYVHGDKETFHLAFRKLEKAYSMPEKPIHALDRVMCQHDFEGCRIFQHRNLVKWSLHGDNPRIADFWYEDRCRMFLADLRHRWDGRIRVPRYHADSKSEMERQGGTLLTSRIYDYHRVGYDRRPMTFLPDGAIGLGAARCEVYWDLREQDGDLLLEISREAGLTCVLKDDGTGVWRGQWIDYEKMPIELS